MRVVSPVALSAFAVVAVQNFADTAVTHPPSGPEPPKQPERDNVVDRGIKPKPVKPAVPPETLSIQQFAGAQASLNLGKTVKDSYQQPQPAQPEKLPIADRRSPLALSASPVVENQTIPERKTLPPLDPAIDTVINAELGHAPVVPAASEPSAVPDRAIAADPLQDSSTSTAPPAADQAANIPGYLPPESSASSAQTSDIPDYLLPKQAAALGFDRISARETSVAASQPESVSPINSSVQSQVETSPNQPTSEPQVPDYLLPKQAATVDINQVPTQPQPAPPDYVVPAEPIYAIPTPAPAPLPAIPELSETTIELAETPQASAATSATSATPAIVTALPHPTAPTTLLTKDPLELGGNRSFANSVQQQEDQLVAMLSGESITAHPSTHALPVAVWENVPTGDLAFDRPQSAIATQLISSGTVFGREAEYLLKAGDRIRVEVLNLPEYCGEFQVLTNGVVNLPLIGTLLVQGMTLKQASDAIAAKYEPVLERSGVTVRLSMAQSLTMRSLVK